MRVFECMGIGLSLPILLVCLSYFRVLSNLDCLLPLLARELSSLDHALLFRGLFEFSLPLRLLLLLFELGLRCRRRFGLKIRKFLLLFSQPLLCFMLLDERLNLRWLHACHVGELGSMTHRRGELVVLADGCTRHHAEIRGRMSAVEDVALDARLSKHALRTARAGTPLPSRTLARTVLALLLRLLFVMVKQHLLLAIVYGVTDGRL